MNLLLFDERYFLRGDEKSIWVSGRQFEQLRSVYHAEVGRMLQVGLLNGKCGTGRIVQIDESGARIEVDLTDDPPQPLPLTLVCSLPRPKCFKRVVAAATSLGIKRMFFTGAFRVEKSYWQSPLLKQNNLYEHIIAGLEQGRDTILPEISFKKRFKPFVEDELPSIIGNNPAFVAHPYNASPCPFAEKKHCVLVIGPEGGFIPYEIELLEKKGCIPVTAGSRILRVETAIAVFTGRLCAMS